MSDVTQLTSEQISEAIRNIDLIAIQIGTSDKWMAKAMLETWARNRPALLSAATRLDEADGRLKRVRELLWGRMRFGVLKGMAVSEMTESEARELSAAIGGGE